MQKSRMKWLKIKELLLLLLRMLIIGLIVMAFARPTLSGFLGSSKAASSVVIILDRSASMDAEGETGSIFDEAKRLAMRLIDSLEPNDMVTILAYPESGSSLTFGPVNPGPSIKERLSDIELSYQSGNIGQSLKTGLEILSKSPDLNREIYIFSDMQQTGWKNLPPEVLTGETWKNIHLFGMIPPPAGADNIGITNILMPPQLLVPGENFGLEVRLANYGKGTLENLLVGVVVDGERKAQTSATLSPGQPAELRFAFKIDSSGDHDGYVEIDYDRYGLDNRRYFSLHIPGRIKILAVGQTENDLKLLALALDRREAGQINYKGIGAAGLLRENLEDYDVLLLSDIRSLDQARDAAVKRYLDNGGRLFVSLGKQSDDQYWDRFLVETAGINVGKAEGGSGQYIVWDGFDYEHPIFNVYSSDKNDRSRPAIPQIQLGWYRNIGGGITLGSSADGAGLLVESTKKPVIVYSSGFDFYSGDLPAHSFYLPFLVRSIEYLGSRDADIDLNGIVGEQFQWKLKQNINGDIVLVSPSGGVENLFTVNTSIGYAVRLAEYGPPGIYSLESGNSKLGLIAFNVDPVESEPETISPDNITAALGAKFKAIDPDSDLGIVVKEARFGRELWKEFLILALILLILESILGKTSPPAKAEG